MLREYSIDTIDGSVGHKLLELRRCEEEVSNVRVEDDIKCRAEVALGVLIVSVFADGVWKRPGISALALLVGYVLSLRL